MSFAKGIVAGDRLLQQIDRVGVTLLFESNSPQSRKSPGMVGVMSQDLAEIRSGLVEIVGVQFNESEPEMGFCLVGSQRYRSFKLLTRLRDTLQSAESHAKRTMTGSILRTRFNI